MTGNRALLTNFVEKFLETVRFGNNDFAVIAGYGDVVIGSMTIKKVYYVEGLGHNLFSVGQFCDKGLEVAFRKSTCFVRNEVGVDLLTESNAITARRKDISPKTARKQRSKIMNIKRQKCYLQRKIKMNKFFLAEDQAWMESSSDSDQEINENMVFMAQIEKVLSNSEASSSSADEKISEIVQICLWIIDLGCSKHMT
nr:integrase, catalytic region, zinc finger, CCHC-type, peptidase aspartic, catalytic [Tanacetum cinerariifolium]